MSIKPEQVANVAHLARIAMNAKELDAYANDLNNILDLVAIMEQADTDNIEPLADPL